MLFREIRVLEKDKIIAEFRAYTFSGGYKCAFRKLDEKEFSEILETDSFFEAITRIYTEATRLISLIGNQNTRLEVSYES